MSSVIIIRLEYAAQVFPFHSHLDRNIPIQLTEGDLLWNPHKLEKCCRWLQMNVVMIFRNFKIEDALNFIKIR